MAAATGYRPVQVKTTAGAVTLERPKLRGTTEKFASRLFGAHVTKTHALESLSVRDVQATLAEALGDQAAITLDYPFLDASFFRMHPGSPAEPILAAFARAAQRGIVEALQHAKSLLASPHSDPQRLAFAISGMPSR